MQWKKKRFTLIVYINSPIPQHEAAVERDHVSSNISPEGGEGSENNYNDENSPNNPDNPASNHPDNLKIQIENRCLKGS